MKRFVALAVMLVAPSADAAELGDRDGRASVEIHAFASQGFILTSKNEYIAKSSQGSFELTEVGVNFTKRLTDKFRVGLQLFAHRVGETGKFRALADWFYLDYRFADWLGVRAGRVKIPFGLYNEINDIDAARTPILLPQSVYPLQNRDYLLAQSGAELYGAIRSLVVGALEYRLYGGTIFIDPNTSPGSKYQVLDLNVHHVFGGRLMWETPLDGLRMGGSLQTLRLDTNLLVAGTKEVEVRIPATLWVGSVEYSKNDLLIASEYSRWYVSTKSSDPTVIPQSPTIVSERAYVLTSYRVANWFQPGVYYSLFFPNTDSRSGRENVQHDAALTFRYDLDTNWILKLEGHYMSGTAALNSSLNGNAPLSTLQREWGVFLAKTTAYF